MKCVTTILHFVEICEEFLEKVLHLVVLHPLCVLCNQ